MGEILLVTGTVLTGLVAGLFWGWEVAAIPGLRRVDDRTYVLAMRAINEAILNPVFLVAFVGSGPVLVLAAVFASNGTRQAWLAAAAAIELVLVFGVTVLGNVPLNDALAATAPASGTVESAEALAEARSDYERPWNRLHRIRTVASVVALGLVVVAALA